LTEHGFDILDITRDGGWIAIVSKSRDDSGEEV
jgi:hypothetical protein